MQQYPINDCLNKPLTKLGLPLYVLLLVGGCAFFLCFKSLLLGIALGIAVPGATAYCESLDPEFFALKLLSFRQKTHYDPFKRRSVR